MTSFGKQTTSPYLVAVAGVALMTITTVLGAFRSMMARQSFRGNFTGNFTGGRQFGGGPVFGVVNGLTTVAVIITIIGLVWLGLVLRKSASAPKAP